MIYENMVTRLRKAAGPAIDFPDTLYDEAADAIEKLNKRVPPVPHGRLIDADVLRAKMYHEAFETDSPMQKWDSGCWIRYKLFENCLDATPAEDVVEVRHGRWIEQSPDFDLCGVAYYQCSECGKEQQTSSNYC